MPRRYNIRKILAIAAWSLAMTAAARAQIMAPAPYHLARVRGVYVDAKGNPIPNAAVTLNQDDKPRYSTQTDRSGQFEIKHVTGRYSLHISKIGYSPVARDVIVGLEAVEYLHGATLYIIAGPSACSDDCSAVFTSKGKFEHAVRHNTGHQD